MVRRARISYTIRELMLVVACLCLALGAWSMWQDQFSPILWRSFDLNTFRTCLLRGETLVVVIYQGGNGRYRYYALDPFERRNIRRILRQGRVVTMAGSSWEVGGIEMILKRLDARPERLPLVAIYSAQSPDGTVILSDYGFDDERLPEALRRGLMSGGQERRATE